MREKNARFRRLPHSKEEEKIMADTIRYVKLRKSDCEYCGSKDILHQFGFLYEKGQVKKYKKCIKCDIDVLLEDKD